MFQFLKFSISGNHPFQVAPFEDAEVYEVGDTFSLQNGYVRGEFNANGFLQSITTIDDKIKTPAEIQFMVYGTRPRGDKSGAYLFLPDGEAKPVKIGKPYVRIIEGKLLSYVEVHEKAFKHKVYLRSSPGTSLKVKILARKFKFTVYFLRDTLLASKFRIQNFGAKIKITLIYILFYFKK